MIKVSTSKKFNQIISGQKTYKELVLLAGGKEYFITDLKKKSLY